MKIYHEYLKRGFITMLWLLNENYGLYLNNFLCVHGYYWLFCMMIVKDLIWTIIYMSISIFAVFYDNRFSQRTFVEACTFYCDWRVNHLDEEVKIVQWINLLQVQSASDVPEPAATPFPEGHGLHVLNRLSAALHSSAGQLWQPVDWFRACPAAHGSARIKYSYWLSTSAYDGISSFKK